MLNNVLIKIIFDNYQVSRDMQTSHGFSCLIEAQSKNILFDTGSDHKILAANMEKMNISPESIDFLVLSHNHWDHVDGLPLFLQKNKKAKIFILKSFRGYIFDAILKSGLSFCAHQGIVESFKKLGVSFVGPSHCTGEKAIQMFKKEYKDKFIKIGAGKVLNI